jgi:transcriptional regulator with XRE-family HTH domain
MVTRWEKGHIQPKPHTLDKIAQALEIGAQELASGLDTPETLVLRDMDPHLARLVTQLHRLDSKNQEALKTVLEAMLTRSRIHEALVGAE